MNGSAALVLLAAAALGACTQLIDADEATYATVLEVSDAQPDDNFGTQVVLEGDELIVAAPNATLLHTLTSADGACGNGIDAPGAGRVIAFSYRNNDWIQTDELRRTGVQGYEGSIGFSPRFRGSR